MAPDFDHPKWPGKERFVFRIGVCPDGTPALVQLFRAYVNTPDRIAYIGYLHPLGYYIIYNHICTHKVNRKFTSMFGFVEIARFFGTFYSWISYILVGLAYRVTG